MLMLMIAVGKEMALWEVVLVLESAKKNTEKKEKRLQVYIISRLR